MARYRLTESRLRGLIREAVKSVLREETEEDRRRKQEMQSDWEDMERHMEYLKDRGTPSTLGDAFANNWGGAGKTPGELAMDAQLPYVHPYTTQKGKMYRVADTSKWSNRMKGRGYEGPNAARNFARNVRYKPDLVDGMTPYPYDGEFGPTGNIYRDNDAVNFDDQDYFEDKIKSTNDRWYKNQKDYYKAMKKLSQQFGGKRSKKDDERSFRRALKAADSRPLHRKGSLNREID